MTRNPWDTRFTCGGSSGGAAVALAIGQVALATGTDMGGSLRIPGSFCGIVGFRPSPGRVARGPTSTPLDRLSVHGPMARNVRDAALMLDAEVGTHALDPLSQPAPPEPFLAATDRLPAPARVAWTPNLGIAPVDPEVAAIAGRAAAWFAETGAVIELGMYSISPCSSATVASNARSSAAGGWPSFLPQ